MLKHLFEGFQHEFKLWHSVYCWCEIGGIDGHFFSISSYNNVMWIWIEPPEDLLLDNPELQNNDIRGKDISGLDGGWDDS